MVEHELGKGWHKVEMGNSGCFYDVKDSDPKILALMPENGRNFLEIRPFEGAERFVNKMKKLLRGKPNNLLP
jgi:hypothetical protein